MALSPLPSDQHIIDEYFRLMATPGLQQAGWVFGMVAVYGKTPEELSDIQWKDNFRIIIKNRRKSLKPFHPQWTLLFRLKENQPATIKAPCAKLNKAIKEGYINIDVPHLLEAYKKRRNFYSVN